MRPEGGARLTRSVVAVWPFFVPDVPWMLSESAYGSAALVVLTVRVDDPDPPPMVGGEKPPIETPAGIPPSLSAASVTVPLKFLTGVTVTVKVADCPGVTVRDCWATESSKSLDCGRT